MTLIDKLLNTHSPKRIAKELYPSRVAKLLTQLGFDINNQKYIHITGSKGKGSIAFNCFSILRQSHKVGLFTSPHVLDIRERFTTNQGMISTEKLEQLIQTYNIYFEDLHFFEICLFLALIYFIEEKCEYIILEVGVGGRFDPTNFCKPIVSLLGHISLEHKKFLGDTIEKIAYDKAGIIKTGSPAFSVEQCDIVTNILKQEGEISFLPDIINISNYKQENTIQSFDLKIVDSNNTITINKIHLNRLGKAHLINFVIAVVGLWKSVPDFSEEWIYQAMSDKFPYRMDIIKDDIMLDSAHNGASFENLLLTLKDLGWDKNILYLTILKEKEIQDICEQLILHKDIIHHIEFFEFETKNTRTSDAYSLYLNIKDHIPSIYHQNITSIKLHMSHKKVFAGSFYSIPMILDIINN